MVDVPLTDQDQWRGWIRGLAPGTDYELEITLDPNGSSRTVITKEFRTWDSIEDWPVASVITLAATYPAGLNLSSLTSGGIEGAYVAVQPAAGGTVITAPADGHGLIVNVPYIIFRRNSTTNSSFTIQRGASDYRHGISLEAAAHDVVVQGFSISNFGLQEGSTGFGATFEGIHFSGAGNHHIVIQENLVGPPRWDAQNWGESNPAVPLGASALQMQDATGFNFIGHNSFLGDATHRFADIIGKGADSFMTGNGGDWCHVYRNRLEYGWEDAYEFNGRAVHLVEENWTDHCFESWSMRPCTIGPAWLIRNIAGRDARTTETSITVPFSSRFVTMSATGLSSGRMFIACNTSLATLETATMSLAGPNAWLGVDGEELVTRNNIGATRSASGGPTIQAVAANSDYDAYRTVSITSPFGAVPPETHGVLLSTAPVYTNDTNTFAGDYRLAVGSIGRGVGQALPGITVPGVVAPDLGMLHNTEVMPVFGATQFAPPPPAITFGTTLSLLQNSSTFISTFTFTGLTGLTGFGKAIVIIQTASGFGDRNLTIPTPIMTLNGVAMSLLTNWSYNSGAARYQYTQVAIAWLDNPANGSLVFTTTPARFTVIAATVIPVNGAAAGAAAFGTPVTTLVGSNSTSLANALASTVASTSWRIGAFSSRHNTATPFTLTDTSLTKLREQNVTSTGFPGDDISLVVVRGANGVLTTYQMGGTWAGSGGGDDWSSGHSFELKAGS